MAIIAAGTKIADLVNGGTTQGVIDALRATDQAGALITENGRTTLRQGAEVDQAKLSEWISQNGSSATASRATKGSGVHGSSPMSSNAKEKQVGIGDVRAGDRVRLTYSYRGKEETIETGISLSHFADREAPATLGFDALFPVDGHGAVGVMDPLDNYEVVSMKLLSRTPQEGDRVKLSDGREGKLISAYNGSAILVSVKTEAGDSEVVNRPGRVEVILD